MKHVAALMLALTLGGCASADFSRNLYEGVRQRQEAVPDPAATPPTEKNPDYDRYRRERDALQDAPPR